MRGMIILFVGMLVGCATRTCTVPRQTKETIIHKHEYHLQSPDSIRRISVSDLDKPLTLEAPKPVVDGDAMSAVTQDELIGLWRGNFTVVTRIIDMQKMTEEVKTARNSGIAEYCADGTCQVNGDKGRWLLNDDVLSVDFRPAKDLTRSTFIRWINANEIVLTFTDAALDECRRQLKRGYQKGDDIEVVVRKCGYEDMCYCYEVSIYQRGTMSELFRISGMYSPAVMKKVSLGRGTGSGEVAVEAKILSRERKKNLDSLLKSGVITEEEYKKELGKGAK